MPKGGRYLDIDIVRTLQALNIGSLMNTLRSTVMFLNSQGDIFTGFILLLIAYAIIKAMERKDPQISCE
jgi:hypothetical protein